MRMLALHDGLNGLLMTSALGANPDQAKLGFYWATKALIALALNERHSMESLIGQIGL